MRVLVFLALGVLCSARRLDEDYKHSRNVSFVGCATHDVTVTLFEDYNNDDKNIAFSPLGYAVILAILAEGAQGESRKQLVKALHLPDDRNKTREIFHDIMERLKNTHEYKHNQPELKNFLYVYKNNTINTDYKNILEHCYLTEVRSVERYNGEQHFKPDESCDNDKSESEIVIDDSKDVRFIYKDKKDIPTSNMIENETIKFHPTYGDTGVHNTESKLPENIKETDFQPTKEVKEAFGSIKEYSEQIPAKNIKEKIKLAKINPKKEESGEEEETMVAVEARNHARSLKVLADKNDVTSSISVNSVGKKYNKSSTTNSLMIIFNGMYFRGSWKKPFDSVETGVFYKSNVFKKRVQMMKARGVYKTGHIPGLDSTAIEIPYDGGRYVLLLLVPRARDGLRYIADDLYAMGLMSIDKHLNEEELYVSIPSFYVETTTKPVSALAKFGVINIFTPNAELSGVSSDEGLFVQELVQHVAVRVDNTDASASQLSVADPAVEAAKNAPLNEKEPRIFRVEHPFLFFIVDRLDQLVVVAGKVTDPENPTDYEI